MVTFGSRLWGFRKAKDLSKKLLTGILKTNHSVIGMYESDYVKPSISMG
jgi:transcriptional regulator with XRE-family HTH domain